MRYPAVEKVIPENDYVLAVTFDNGECGTLNIKPILEFGVFKGLKTKTPSNRVRVSFDTIEWDCGVDLDPEYVYQKCMETDAAMGRAYPLKADSASAVQRGKGEK